MLGIVSVRITADDTNNILKTTRSPSPLQGTGQGKDRREDKERGTDMPLREYNADVDDIRIPGNTSWFEN